MISGPAGCGKTTLAHNLAGVIGCPAISRDQIKEGMVHTEPQFVADWGDPLTKRASTLFFELIATLLDQGVTHVADAAFQDQVWRPHLEPLRSRAKIRVAQCYASTAIAHRRVCERGVRRAHADQALLNELEKNHQYYVEFDRYQPEFLTLNVDTTDGYDPSLPDIADFINKRQPTDPSPG